MDEYEKQRENFAIETTLASRTLAPRVKRLQAVGHQFQLMFFWLNSPELNIQRVAERVRNGGHHTPENVIRRRSVAGLKNFFTLYLPLADVWRAYDNSDLNDPHLVARGQPGQPPTIFLPEPWKRMKEIADNG